MISRIACAILLLSATASTDSVTPSPLFEMVGPTPILLQDLEKAPLPPELLARLRPWLKSERDRAQGNERRDEVDLALGLLEFGEKHYDQAAAYFRRMTPSGRLRDASLVFEAKATRLQGEMSEGRKPSKEALENCRKALNAYTAFERLPPGPLSEEAQAEAHNALLCEVRLLIELKRTKEARASLSALLYSEDPLPAEDRTSFALTLASLLKNEGKGGDARQLLESVRAEALNDPRFVQLDTALPPLSVLSPTSPAPSLDLPKATVPTSPEGRLLAAAAQAGNAGKMKRQTELLVTVLRDYAGSLGARRATAQLRAVTDRLTAEPQVPHYFVSEIKSLPAEQLYPLAKTLWETDHEEEAYTLFQYFVKEYAASTLAGNVHYSLGRMEENRGDWKAARQHFESVVTRYSASAFFERSHFKMGWLSYLSHDDRKAVEWLDRDRGMTDEPLLLAQSLYWLSKAHARLGNSALAQKYRDAIPKLAPLSYYAFLSSQIPPFSNPPPTSLAQARDYRNTRRLGRARSFLAAGLPEIASQVLGEVNPDGDPWTAEEVAVLYAAARKYPSAIRVAWSLLTSPSPTEPSRRLVEVLFPRPLEEAIRTEASTNRVDPLLLLSLVKQESAFQEDAESPVGALGLMQLMPSTARGIAKDHGETAPAREDLLGAARNLSLGSRYLAGLLKKYDGNTVLALAAYNAGPQKVTTWANRWNKLAPEEFVELIPYDETRNYVKSILRNYAVYARLIDQRSVALSEIAVLKSL